MRQIIGYTLITLAASMGIVFLAVSAFALGEIRAVFGFGSAGLFVAGLALCADEFFGISFPRKGVKKSEDTDSL